MSIMYDNALNHCAEHERKRSFRFTESLLYCTPFESWRAYDSGAEYRAKTFRLPSKLSLSELSKRFACAFVPDVTYTSNVIYGGLKQCRFEVFGGHGVNLGAFFNFDTNQIQLFRFRLSEIHQKGP